MMKKLLKFLKRLFCRKQNRECRSFEDLVLQNMKRLWYFPYFIENGPKRIVMNMKPRFFFTLCDLQQNPNIFCSFPCGNPYDVTADVGRWVDHDELSLFICRDGFIGDLVKNPNFTWSNYLWFNEPRFYFNWQFLSRSPGITMDIVEQNISAPWDWISLGKNPNLTCEFVEKYFDRRWNFRLLSEHPCITMDFVERYPNKPWNFVTMSENPNVTIDFVLKHLNKPWHTANLSAHPNITLDIVRTTPQIDWDYNSLSKNPNITWEIVQANPDIEWDYVRMSANPNITVDIVLANPHLKWSFNVLSENPSITWRDVANHLDLPWNFYHLSMTLCDKYNRYTKTLHRFGGIVMIKLYCIRFRKRFYKEGGPGYKLAMNEFYKMQQKQN